MIPSNDTRLASMASALTGAVLPALGTSNPFALEQAQLVVGHLQIIRAQEPHADEFEHLDYNRVRVFARELLDTAEGGPATDQAAAAVRDLLEGPVPYTTPAVRRGHDELAAAIGVLISAIGEDGEPESLSASETTTLRHEAENAMRYRAYFALMGYEDGSIPMPDLETLMTEFRAAYGAR